ncbi:MAG: hypothetical protein L6R42_002027, partial [Xanthoria sp. 1 TBL-2021]
MPRGRPTAASKATTSTPLKRARSSSPTSKTLTPPARESKRLKSSPLTASATKTNPKKSPYFTNSTASEPESESEIEAEAEAEASGYEDEDASISAVSSPPESEDEDDEEEYVSSEEDKKTKRKAKRGSAMKAAPNGKGVDADGV